MNNITMTIKVEAPDLVAAIKQLVGAINSRGSDMPQPQMDAAPVPSAPPTPQPPVAASVPSAAPAVPVAPATSPAAPVAAPAPAPAAPAVPLAGASTYTLEQIAKAGASLVDAGKMEPLLALLSRYGVQAVTQLAPEHYGAFATELRALGAQI